MDIDLNEEHYEFEDLLQLFNLSPEFDEKDLKAAKKKVLKLHPDKCELPKEYFLFFRKMYLKIEEIYAFMNHASKEEDLSRSIDIEPHFKDFLEKQSIDPIKNYKQFSLEFNKMFDHVYIKEENGYGDWLKSKDDFYDKDNLEESRKKIIQNKLTTVTEIEEVGLEPTQQLYAFDIKETHGKPIMDMDINEVYEQKPKFQNVHEYQQFLTKQDEQNMPTNLQQSQDFLKYKEDLLNLQSKKMAYQHMKQKENTDEKYKHYISTYLSLN
uniref:J domain-containing protein n=1 Tax=viral metagenome TaxID=1070528 RepID=A0A6C0KJJ1_9ZZZZ